MERKCENCIHFNPRYEVKKGLFLPVCMEGKKIEKSGVVITEQTGTQPYFKCSKNRFKSKNE